MKPKTPFGKELLGIRTRLGRQLLKIRNRGMEKEEMTILKDLRELKRLHDNRNFGECLYCAALIDILIKHFGETEKMDTHHFEQGMVEGFRHIKAVSQVCIKAHSSCAKSTKSIGGRSDKGRSLHKKKGE